MVENTPWDLTVSLTLQSLSKVHQESVASLPLKADFTISFIRFLVLFDILENQNIVLKFTVFLHMCLSMK